MDLKIRHRTRYRYPQPALVAQHVACLSPCSSPSQTVLSHSLHITPTPDSDATFPEGPLAHQRYFAIEHPHDTLCVTATSHVRTLAPRPLPPSPVWTEVQNSLRYAVDHPYHEAHAWVFASPYVKPMADFVDYARPTFGKDVELLSACQQLMRRIHREFTYESASTHIDTPAHVALKQRKGVCQDFAHIMVACLRSLGLPARYVSGYLLTHPPKGQPRLVGADASHAWVQVYSPTADGDKDGGDWFDFDPTNDQAGWGRPAESYVTLAVGRDFGDVSPIRGIIQGGAQHDLDVGVTVAPSDEFDALMAAESSKVDSASPSSHS